jgi:ribonuclease BN (tRNA processing enzyme)
MSNGLFASRCAAALLAFTAASADASSCAGDGIALQVLGSGGPERVDARAASSYLVRQNGKPRVLVDIGGGSAVRFGESGAHVADLDLILLTHLHVDHAGDLPALVKSSYFEDRQRPLPVLGPGAGGLFPSTTDFLLRLFGKAGAFAYLGEYLAGGAYTLQPQNVQPKKGQLLPAFEMKGLKASAAALRHGTVPALGWRLEVGAASIVFSGDTDGSDDVLVHLSKGADLFVAHNAVPSTQPVRPGRSTCRLRSSAASRATRRSGPWCSRIA